MTKGKRKLDEVVEYVQENELYLKEGIKKYQVRYNGVLYRADDTRGLVLEVMNHAHPKCSVRGY